VPALRSFRHRPLCTAHCGPRRRRRLPHRRICTSLTAFAFAPTTPARPVTSPPNGAARRSFLIR
jgi:hypothetical protein